MENLWIYFVILYAFLRAARESMKKMAASKTPILEILFLYTFIGFLLAIPHCAEAVALPPLFIGAAFVKAFFCYMAWLLSLYALRKMPVSLFGILSLSGVLFSTVFSVIFFHEAITLPKVGGLLLVLLGLFLVNRGEEKADGKCPPAAIIAVFVSCFFNSSSAVIDKAVLVHITPTALQFWFMLFLALIAAAGLLLRKEKISFRPLKTNFWIPLMSLTLVYGDLLWFTAQKDPNSQLLLITLLNQSSILFTLLIGRIFFREKRILYKLFCAAIIVFGIILPLFAA